MLLASESLPSVERETSWRRGDYDDETLGRRMELVADELASKLRTSGYRMTPQRQAAIEALEGEQATIRELAGIAGVRAVFADAGEDSSAVLVMAESWLARAALAAMADAGWRDGWSREGPAGGARL